MQCTAQRQQKAANTSLLESRNLLQTATLVFPRPIVCTRLSNNINILAIKLSGRQRGRHGPPAPDWIRHCSDEPPIGPGPVDRGFLQTCLEAYSLAGLRLGLIAFSSWRRLSSKAVGCATKRACDSFSRGRL